MEPRNLRPRKKKFASPVNLAKSTPVSGKKLSRRLDYGSLTDIKPKCNILPCGQSYEHRNDVLSTPLASRSCRNCNYERSFKPPVPNSWKGRLRQRVQLNGSLNKSFSCSTACSVLLKDCNTSDYGTASDCSRNSVGVSTYPSPSSVSDLCRCSEQSGVTSIRSTFSSQLDPESDADSDCHLSNVGWDSDSEIPTCDFWETNSEEFLAEFRHKDSVRILRKEDVYVIVPRNNVSGYGEFSLQIIKDPAYVPACTLRMHHASHVISVEPHGTEFFGNCPALIVLPLNLEPKADDCIVCFCSNTPSHAKPKWERLPPSDFKYSDGRVTITAQHFSLFTCVVQEPYPEIRRRVRRRIGGHLRHSAVPGLEITFPKGSLTEDITANVRILFDGEPGSDPQFHPQERALASPIIMVEPHGYQFDTTHPPVQITLPVPDYEGIVSRFGARLSVWQSATSDNEPPNWECLELEPVVQRIPHTRLYTVSFTVYHFSFFKVLWDVLCASLYEAKMGMSHFYPYVSFSMMCQAFMEENTDTSRFGLEVICHRSDRRLPEMTNYKHRVGASLKPKLVRPGRILVRLKSQLFEADVDAGEDADMVKEEFDFRGRDFEKQYACRFKAGAQVDRGTFGKVVVERAIPGERKDTIFEFNLHKTGNEGEATPPESSDRWSVVAIKELADTLHVLEGNNWKRLAKHIGFTHNEIKAKLQYSADPFLAMMNMYQARQGSPEEFLQALYAVSREIQLSATGAGGSTPTTSSATPSPSHSQGSSNSQNSSLRKRGGLLGLMSLARWRTKDEDSDQSTSIKSQQPAPNKSKTSSGGTKTKTSGGSAAKRPRRQYSDISETISSSSSEIEASADEDDEEERDIPVAGSMTTRTPSRKKAVKRKRGGKVKTPSPVRQEDESEDERSTEKCKRDPRVLTDKNLWQISSLMNNINWRALGRTLGLQESALVNIETSHRSAGCRECVYQMLLEWKGQKPKQCTVGNLYAALTKENMNEVAKKLASTAIEPE